jgi:segregation and condensation protein B
MSSEFELDLDELVSAEEFLDYFGMKGLGELPTLAEIKDLDSFYGELDLEVDAEENEDTAEDSESADNATETLDEPAAVAEQSADDTATDEVNEKEVEVVKEVEEQPNLSEQHGG